MRTVDHQHVAVGYSKDFIINKELEKRRLLLLYHQKQVCVPQRTVLQKVLPWLAL
jgi:hypothetical protein